MADKSKKVALSYSPSESDFKHAHHCIKHNLINVLMSRVNNYKDEYYLVRIDLSKTPPVRNYFLKDFSKLPTPSNKKIFTEYEAYKKIFELYKEFYMRNMNITEEEIMENIKKTKKEEIEAVKKQKTVKKTKKELNEERLINFPHKQISLLDMIEECEKENTENGL